MTYNIRFQFDSCCLQVCKSKYNFLVDDVFDHPCYSKLLTELSLHLLLKKNNKERNKGGKRNIFRNTPEYC